MQAITHFNQEIIELVGQGVPIFIIEKTMAKMLNLPKMGITKLPSRPRKRTKKEKGKGRQPSTRKLLHQKHLSIGMDGRFLFSRDCM